MTENTSQLTNGLSKESKAMKIGVLGGGSFGTTLANIAAKNGHDVVMWMRDKSQAASINQEHINPKYLSDLTLHENLTASHLMADSIKDKELVIIAVPSKAFAEVVDEMMQHINKKSHIVSGTKGIAPDNFCLMSEILSASMQANQIDPAESMGVLSGPNIAKEIVGKHLSGSVIACTNKEIAGSVRRALTKKYLQIFDNDDIYGVELGGALKNVYAIAAGISDSLSFGVNTKSLLLSRSIYEITNFASKLSAEPFTFIGLAGFGDLIATCFSQSSRNYSLGKQLGEGRSLDEVCANLGGVAEGVNTTRMTYLKAQDLGIEMPLLEVVHKILFEQYKPKNALWKALRSTAGVDVRPVFTAQ